MNALVGVVAGPIGWVPLLAVIGFLVSREFAGVRRPVTVPRTRSTASPVAVGAVVLALAILALRFYGFS